MATRTETLRIRTTTTRTSPQFGRKITRAVGNWFRQGQLGSPASMEKARYTGARV
jgi:hypothetical protein